MPQADPIVQADRPSVLSEDQAAALRETFFDAVARLNAANGAEADWWLTWVSTRDRYRPQLWNRMLQLAKSAAANGGLQRGTSRGSISRAWQAVADWGAFHLLLAKHVWLGIDRVRAARAHPAAPISEPVDAIIVTILTERAVTSKGPYEDLYFGRLHEWLAENGERVIFCGFPEGDASAILAKAAARKDVDILSYGHLLSLGDVIKAWLRAVTVRFLVPAMPSLSGHDIGPLVRSELRRDRISVFEGYLYRLATQRLLARHRNARLIHMYENNGWERANYQAAKSALPPRPVIGYLHCSVLRSHLKNAYPREERGMRPMPDRVVTTGPLARDLLLALGQYPEGLVVAGCGLRSPQLSQIRSIAPARRPVRTVLALFEGLVTVIPALQIFDEAARRRRGTRFLIRCHPQLPAERLAPLAGVAYGPNESIDLSSPLGLEDAIAEADAVVYISSTAALYALYAGRPVIKLDIDEVLDDDPLTATTALKFRAKTATAILDALNTIDSLDAEKVAGEAAEGRRYLEAYLAAPTTTTVAPFLRSPRI